MSFPANFPYRVRFVGQRVRARFLQLWFVVAVAASADGVRACVCVCAYVSEFDHCRVAVVDLMVSLYIKEGCFEQMHTLIWMLVEKTKNSHMHVYMFLFKLVCVSTLV